MAEFDFDAVLRWARFDPQRTLTRRRDNDLPFVNPNLSGGQGLLLDTSVDVDQMKDRSPPILDDLIAQRQVNHSTVANDPHIRTVILASAWTALVRATLVSDRPDLDHRLQLFRQGLNRLFVALAPLQRRVVILGEVPQWGLDTVPCAIAADTSLLRRKCQHSFTDRIFVDNFQADAGGYQRGSCQVS
jgi:SGNH domain (fused to AT3 domains)